MKSKLPIYVSNKEELKLFQKVWDKIMDGDKPFKLPFDYYYNHSLWFRSLRRFFKRCRKMGYEGRAIGMMNWFDKKLEK